MTVAHCTCGHLVLPVPDTVEWSPLSTPSHVWEDGNLSMYRVSYRGGREPWEIPPPQLKILYETPNVGSCYQLLQLFVTCSMQVRNVQGLGRRLGLRYMWLTWGRQLSGSGTKRAWPQSMGLTFTIMWWPLSCMVEWHFMLQMCPGNRSI